MVNNVRLKDAMRRLIVVMVLLAGIVEGSIRLGAGRDTAARSSWTTTGQEVASDDFTNGPSKRSTRPLIGL